MLSIKGLRRATFLRPKRVPEKQWKKVASKNAKAKGQLLIEFHRYIKLFAKLAVVSPP